MGGFDKLLLKTPHDLSITFTDMLADSLRPFFLIFVIGHKVIEFVVVPARYESEQKCNKEKNNVRSTNARKLRVRARDVLLG